MGIFRLWLLIPAIFIGIFGYCCIEAVVGVVSGNAGHGINTWDPIDYAAVGVVSLAVVIGFVIMLAVCVRTVIYWNENGRRRSSGYRED